MHSSKRCRVALLTSLSIALLTSISLGLLNGCGLYHERYRTEDVVVSDDKTHKIHFIEADDEGWFWRPEQADAALATLREAAAAGDVIVVTFVHGWHHSARCCDGNVEGFKEILRRLSKELSRNMYTEARGLIHRPQNALPPVQVIGLYIGWRGRSLPGWLDYLTFWKRKSVAARVGDSDVQELMMRLRQLHEERTTLVDAATPAADRKLFGLVTIGHSFGGQVVLRATSAYIEHQLTSVSALPGYLRLSTPSPGGADLAQPLRGFGDLVVLVNPAVEASAYQRLHALSHRLRYNPAQVPLILTISAENDGARHTAFRVGRMIGEWFTAKPGLADARESEMGRQALGVFPEHVTHELRPVDASLRLEGRSTRSVPEAACANDRGICKFEWYDWTNSPGHSHEQDTLSAESGSEENLWRIGSHDFGSRTVFSGVVLQPVKGGLPHQPLIVAAADRNVLDGHTGFFSRPLMDFLTKYIGFVEAKKLLPVLQAAKGVSPAQTTDN